MNDHEFEEWVKRADYNHDALIAEVTRLQQARADDTVLLGTVAAERDAALQRAEQAEAALAQAQATLQQSRCLRAEVEQAQAERDAATRREEESSAAQYARAERLQAVRDDCVRNEAALIADRDAWKARAEAAEQRLAEFNAYLADAPTVGRQCPLCRADAEFPPLPDGWREVPTCGAVRTYMCVNHAYRYVEVFLDGTVRISWALDLPTAITVLRHAEQAHQQLKEGK